MNPLISVIIPVYNVEKYICRCLDSVLQQTYRNYEIILINDGSTDNSGNICQHYQSIEPKITLLSQKNQGLSSARNVGIELAKGAYLTFIDSDDCVRSSYLEKLLKVMEKHDADISFCGSECFGDEFSNELINKNFDGIRSFSGRDACKLIYSKEGRVDYGVAWGKLYKRELFSEYRYPIGRLHEDQFLTYKLFYASSKVVEIGECLYGYFQNPEGIMRSPFSIKRYDGIVAYDETKKFFLKKKEYEIVELVNVCRDELLADYSIRARKAGFYKNLPRQYKMSYWKARKILKKLYGIDQYEYIMYQFYPNLILFEARLRKLKRIIIRKDE